MTPVEAPLPESPWIEPDNIEFEVLPELEIDEPVGVI